MTMARRTARAQRIALRGLEHHVLTWGDPGAPKLFLLHGWMDVAASFQFLVDALHGDWQVIAPDLRGFGKSAWQPQGYWFFDYVADLEHLIEAFASGETVNLVGHSLGGNIVMHYGGARPARVRRLVSLDGFGIPGEHADRAPAKLAQWLDALREPADFRPYPSLDAVARRLIQNNPRLPRDRAHFLAEHCAEALPDGTARLNSDPRHKLPFPSVYRLEEVYAVWRNITAATLWVAAADSNIPRWLDAHPEGEAPTDSLAGIRRRLAHIRGARLEVIPDAGHMLHHDQPEAVARVLEGFLAD
jgi:pimeloyl-ACP methyl ester carboxylesterase